MVGCFAAGGTGALHKIDGIMRKENYVEKLSQNLKTTTTTFGHKRVFHVNNDPKHTFKVVLNGSAKFNKKVQHKALTSIPKKMYGQN